MVSILKTVKNNSLKKHCCIIHAPQCRLINSLSIILQNDLYIKSSTVGVYVYDCHINHIYIYIHINLRIILLHVILLYCSMQSCIYNLTQPNRCLHTCSVLKDTNQEAIFSDRRGQDTVRGQYHMTTLHCMLSIVKMYSPKVYCIHTQYNVY